jgi:uncharacterized membrane protein
MPKTGFWKGFAAGAAAGTGAVMLPQLVGRAGASRIVRLEKSIQIGRPVDEVYAAWTDWERLPRAAENIADIRHYGDRSHWRIEVNGRTFKWDAIVEQRIPNQAIGWKSINGVKHTGRVTFSPISNDTLVLVTMNYAPPSRALRPFLSPLAGHMEGLIEKVLRDFKASVESRPRGVQGSIRSSADIGPGTDMTGLPKTGTFGTEPRSIEPRFGGTTSPVTTPPDLKR